MLRRVGCNIGKLGSVEMGQWWKWERERRGGWVEEKDLSMQI